MIDGAGGYHLATGCDGGIRYSVLVGTNWETTEFAPPDKRREDDPQLAFDGDVLYMAYTRIAVEEGGCGDPGLRDVGTYVRSRALPDGGWSEPKLIGEVADHVESFRVVGGTIHAAVESGKDGRRYYETLRGTSYHRYQIANANGEVALRVGDDGRARIAYQAAGALWYGVFTGADLSTNEIRGTDRGYRPVLVLGAGDRPYLVWNRGYHGGGCAEPEPEPDDGLYFSTMVGGAWQSERLTPTQGAASLTLDVDADRLHAVFTGPDGLMYASKSGTDPWIKRTIADKHPGDPVIRLDPRTGALLVAYVVYENDAQRVYVLMYR